MFYPATLPQGIHETPEIECRCSRTFWLNQDLGSVHINRLSCVRHSYWLLYGPYMLLGRVRYPKMYIDGSLWTKGLLILSSLFWDWKLLKCVWWSGRPWPRADRLPERTGPLRIKCWRSQDQQLASVQRTKHRRGALTPELEPNCTFGPSRTGLPKKPVATRTFLLYTTINWGKKVSPLSSRKLMSPKRTGIWTQ